MYSIGCSLRGSHAWGGGKEPGDDVDLFLVYAQSPAQTLLGIAPKDVAYKIGALDCEALEIKQLAERLVSGDFKVFISTLSPALITSTPWYVQIRSILSSYLTMGFADSMVQYIEEILSSDKADKLEKAMRYIQFGIGYYEEKMLNLTPVKIPEGGFKEEDVKSRLDDLKAAIVKADEEFFADEQAPEKKFKIYNDEAFSRAVQQWIIGTRSNLIKIEENIMAPAVNQ